MVYLIRFFSLVVKNYNSNTIHPKYRRPGIGKLKTNRKTFICKFPFWISLNIETSNKLQKPTSNSLGIPDLSGYRNGCQNANVLTMFNKKKKQLKTRT